MIEKDDPKVGLTHAGVGWLGNHCYEGGGGGFLHALKVLGYILPACRWIAFCRTARDYSTVRVDRARFRIPLRPLQLLELLLCCMHEIAGRTK